MKRPGLLLLALLLAGTFGFAKDRDRPRRNPSSAKPPPPDWKSLLENGERDVRALLVPWLEARTEIEDYRIREVRGLGDIAYAMVEVRRVPSDGESEWIPDVSTWRRIARRWDLQADPPVRHRRARIRLPDRLRPKPTHQAEALAAHRRVEERIGSRPSGAMRGITLRVVSHGPGPDRDQVFAARWEKGRFHVVRKDGAFGREPGRSAAGVVERFLDAALVKSASRLPPAGDYHLEMRGDTLVMRGFAPQRFMETVTVAFDENGLPRCVTRERPGSPSVRHLLRFREHKGAVRLVGATHLEGKERFELSVRWAKQCGLWLPKRAEVRVPDGTYSLAFTASRPDQRARLQ